MRKTALVILLLAGVGAAAVIAVSVQWSLENPGCLNIFWTGNGGDYMEVRCPKASWLIKGNIVGSGTMDARDEDKSQPTFNLNAVQRDAVKDAEEVAWRMVNDLMNLGNNKCTQLFGGSKLFQTSSWVKHPLTLMQEYVVYRDGENVASWTQDAYGRLKRTYPCRDGYDAWTTTGGTRVIHICNSFARLNSMTLQAQKLIHEGLHVAGQLEDQTNSVGPGDPPRSSQIQEAVQQVCR